MQRHVVKRAVLAAALAVIAVSVAFAEEIFIEVTDTGFYPRSVIIASGDTVTWTYRGGSDQHNVVFLHEAVSSGPPANAPWVFSHTFVNPGVYQYVCMPHSNTIGEGQSGVIFVGNRLPRSPSEEILQLATWDFVALDAATKSGFVSEGYRQTTEGPGLYRAGVTLPPGAMLTGIELTACDSSSAQEVRADLMKCPGAGGACAVVLSVATGSTANPGCTYAATNPAAPVRFDNLDETAAILLSMPASTEVSARSLRIFYRLTVAPAGAPTFTDVPETHPFFKFIEALASAGLTAGCSSNPPQYCPDAPVTRGQLAVFLAQALGLYWPN